MRRLQQILGRKHQRNLHVCTQPMTNLLGLLSCCHRIWLFLCFAGNIHSSSDIWTEDSNLCSTTFCWWWSMCSLSWPHCTFLITHCQNNVLIENFSMSNMLKESVRTSFQFESSWTTGFSVSLSGMAKSCVCRPPSTALQICPSRSTDYSRLCVSVNVAVLSLIHCFFPESFVVFCYLFDYGFFKL